MPTTVYHDTLQRFLFESLPVRGEIASLQETYQSILERHHYPKVVQKLLGELLVTTCLLTATLKFEGDITVQLQGDGPLSFAVINGNNQQQMRGVARFSDDIAENSTLQEMVGKAFLAITIMPKDGERYQGIVAIEHDSLAKCIDHYFNQSEQLPTRIFLFADPDFKGGMAAGVLLQMLPNQQPNKDEFERLCLLTETLKANEIFTLANTEILHRLFHEDDLSLFETTPVTFKCTCNKMRCEAALLTLSDEELNDLLTEKNELEICCDYCATCYYFKTEEIEQLRIAMKHTH